MLSTLATALLVLTSSPPHPTARQMIVVIDAGHGGTAKGAVGVGGALEKHIALTAATKLRSALGQLVGVKVVMTRKKDVYLTLSERVRRANRARGQLFVSLHCNASPTHSQRGYEAFVLSPRGLDAQARPGPGAPLTVASALRGKTGRLALSATLADLARRGQRRHSVAFGKAVVRSLTAGLGRAHSRGLQQAKFDVLRGLNMPGVLIEMGFLDHPTEGRKLQEAAYVDRIVQAVARAITRYGKRSGLFPRSSAANPSTPPRRAPKLRKRRRDRRRTAPTRDPHPLRKPEVAWGFHSA